MHLRNDMRREHPEDLNLTPRQQVDHGGEATESFSAKHAPESPASTIT